MSAAVRDEEYARAFPMSLCLNEPASLPRAESSTPPSCAAPASRSAASARASARASASADARAHGLADALTGVRHHEGAADVDGVHVALSDINSGIRH